MPSSFVDEINWPSLNAASLTDPRSDEKLVAAAKAGDELAFETLVKRYQAQVFALALRYTRVREDAEDVVQQTFLKVFVYLQDFQGKSSFCTWLTRIAINEALMLLRKTRATREVPMGNSTNDEETARRLDVPDTSPNPEASYLQREASEHLCVAMDRLEPAIRSALEFHIRDLTAREIARCLGVSVTAVKARLFQARRKLRKILRCDINTCRSRGTNPAPNMAQGGLCNISG